MAQNLHSLMNGGFAHEAHSRGLALPATSYRTSTVQLAHLLVDEPDRCAGALLERLPMDRAVWVRAQFWLLDSRRKEKLSHCSHRRFYNEIRHLSNDVVNLRSVGSPGLHAGAVREGDA